MICCTIVSFICRAMTWSITKERRSVSSKIKLDLHNSKWPLRYKSINHSITGMGANAGTKENLSCLYKI